MGLLIHRICEWIEEVNRSKGLPDSTLLHLFAIQAFDNPVGDPV